MKDVFDTSVGTLEVRVDQESRKFSVYRFNDQHRAVAAAMEDWDYVDLAEVLTRQVGVPETEAEPIATYLCERQMSLDAPPEKRPGRFVQTLLRVLLVRR
jgi:hypothetical protein